MAYIQTPWQPGGFSGNSENRPVMPPDQDLSGDLVGSRGGDPLIDDGQKETPNSVSGLPLLPARLVITEKPPAPPSLEDRMPGTIDEQ
jgi:hypothetical protein